MNEAWISNYMPIKVWDEITYQLLNLNGCTIEVWEWISKTPHTDKGGNYLIMLGSNLNHVSKRVTDGDKLPWYDISQ